jgi:hypothetical protein
MTHEEFIEHLTNQKMLGVEISKKKNKDYADSHDPFANFRESESIGVAVEKAILVRISDKWRRIKRAMRGEELMVDDETMLDTISDMSNYLDILAVYLIYEKDKNRPTYIQD